MKTRWFNSLLVLILLVAAGMPAAGQASVAAAGTHRPMSPMIEIGPQVYPVDLSAPDGPIFTCQVGLSAAVCYDPFQMRHAYQIDLLINAGYDGSGHTIVIIDAFQSPTLEADLDTFDAAYGLPDRSAFFSQVAPDGLTPFDPNDDNMVGWSAEITLDVEWAHAIAPGAKVVLVLAKSNDDADILNVTKYAIDHNLGDIISMSFGENETCVDSALLASQHKLFVKAALKRITLLASSGDQGSAQPSCDGTTWDQAVSSPASDPLVTAVGGTELHAADYCLLALGCDPSVNPAPGTYDSEIVWNEFGSEATGGGYSVLYRAPLYQKLMVHHTRQRAVPDVAYNAAIYHGVLVYWDGGWWLFGGTSAGAPQWAGIVAIVGEKAGHSLGFINFALYLFSAFPNKYAASFHDILDGTNSVVEEDSDGNPVPVDGFDATPAWDASTGLGTPITDQLVSYLIRFTTDADTRRAITDSDPTPFGHHGHHHTDPH